MKRGIVTTFSTLLLLLSCLLGIIALLPGATQKGPLKNFYWLQADTSGIGNAPDTTRWYSYDWCAYRDGTSFDCSSKKPASEFSPRDNFNDSDNVPRSFVQHRNYYYYMTRVAWALLVLGVIFGVLSLLPALVSIFTDKAAGASTTLLWPAFIFMLISAILYTVSFLRGRRAFRNANRDARMGRRTFAVLWAAAAFMLLSTLWSSIMVSARSLRKRRNNSNNFDDYYEPGEGYNRDGAAYAGAGAGAGAARKDYNNHTGTYDNDLYLNGNDMGAANRSSAAAVSQGDAHINRASAGYPSGKAAPENYNVNAGTAPNHSGNKEFKAVSYDSYGGNTGAGAADAAHQKAPTAQTPYPSDQLTSDVPTSDAPNVAPYSGAGNAGYNAPMNRNSGRITDPSTAHQRVNKGYEPQVASNLSNAVRTA